MNECRYHFDDSFWQMRSMDAPCYVPTGGAKRIFYTEGEMYCTAKEVYYTAEEMYYGDEDFGFHPMVCVRT